MSVAIRIDSELMKQAREVATAESRTPALQVAYWAKIGKVALENPELPIEFIRDVILVKASKSQIKPFEFRK